MKHIRSKDIVYPDRRNFLKVTDVLNLFVAEPTILATCVHQPGGSISESDELETTPALPGQDQAFISLI